MSHPLRETLTSVAAWIEEHGAAWALFGAHAVAVRGVPRQTQDVDVTVLVNPADAAEFVARGERHGLVCRVRDPAAFARQYHVLPMRHAQTGIPVDVVLAATEFERRALRRATRETYAGVQLPVFTVEDLVLSKIVSDRERDVSDASVLVRLHGSGLDRAYLERETRLLEQLFDRSDLLRELRRWFGARSSETGSER